MEVRETRTPSPVQQEQQPSATEQAEARFAQMSVQEAETSGHQAAVRSSGARPKGSRSTSRKVTQPQETLLVDEKSKIANQIKKAISKGGLKLFQEIFKENNLSPNTAVKSPATHALTRRIYLADGSVEKRTIEHPIVILEYIILRVEPNNPDEIKNAEAIACWLIGHGNINLHPDPSSTQSLFHLALSSKLPKTAWKLMQTSEFDYEFVDHSGCKTIEYLYNHYKEECGLAMIEALIAKDVDVTPIITESVKRVIARTVGITKGELGELGVFLNAVNEIVSLLKSKNADFSRYVYRLAKPDYKLDGPMELQQTKVDVNAVHASTGQTALMYAAKDGDLVALQTLLGWYANPDIRNIKGENALMLAATGGHLELVTCLRKCFVDINTQDGTGQTALMMAAAGGHYKTVEQLLVYRSDVKIQDKEGKTALVYGCESKSMPTVMHLVKKGAIINPQDTPIEKSPLWVACSVDENDLVIRYLLANAEFEVEPLVRYALEQACLTSSRLMTELVAKGAVTINWLLEYYDFDKKLLIHYAMKQRCSTSEQLMKGLIAKGGVVDLPDRLARYAGHPSKNKYSFMLECGADINQRNDRGRTALMLAATHGLSTAVEYLLYRKPDVNIQSTLDESALILVCKFKQEIPMLDKIFIVKKLIDVGADKSIKDKHGKTALDYAKENSLEELVRLLDENQETQASSSMEDVD
ncbi:ankyrin repeat domain-containing protein [Kistimonas asteriae]|uniref:ankyrin repeat domain-containing protein n=1 Tax=Kistimonas asteriae TaxID=517724 RepID=UPI001BA54019|nr:ankyrin repeat domain-containing protein [Kistimonas asteriae]